MTFKPFLTAEAISSLQQKEAQSSKAQKRTPEQIEAIYSYGNNILVSASAGSGKTFVMVERIIDKILRGITVDRLFISTFTVKAAGELKERLEKKISQALQKATDNDLKTYLNEQLLALQTADIGTMDAFTQKLVNQYGYTLGISPTFRIMTDKSEQDLVKNDVFADLFADYMTGQNQDSFRKLVRNFSGNRKDSSAFRGIVYKIYDFSQATDNPKKWLAEVFLKGARTYTDFSAIPDQEVMDFLACMHETANQLQDVTDLEDYKQVTAKGTPTANYKKHLNMIEHLHEWAMHFETLYGHDGLGRLAADVADLIPSGPAVTVAGVKYPVFKTLQERLTGLKHLETIFKYQSESLPLLELLQAFMQDFSEQYLQAKIQENAFEFSDIAHFAIQILEENPDIRELYQDKYHEVMVDEYQDNNHTQERMLELLSNGHNRFMVGDIKQSIYRFRQADPQIFNQKFKDFQEHPEHGKLILLKENFRSQSEVLDATNSVFTHLMDESVGEILYDGMHQLVAGSPAQKEAHPENKTQVLIYDTDDSSELASSPEEEQINPNEVKLVAKEIIRLHNEEGVAFEDITLLVSSRTRNDGILQTFEHYGIPLVTDGGEQNYLKSVEVMVMLDTLRALDNPLNDYALVALMRSPMFSFNEDDLARLALQTNEDETRANLYQKLEHALANQGQHAELVTPALRQKLKVFMTCFSKWRDFAKWHSLYDLIWKIYNERFYYDYVGNLPRAEQRQANLYALALRANNFEKTGFKGLSRFIRMIDRVLESENDLADVEVALPKHAVNLMTIHKSKGLEFKYVFILNIDKKFSIQDMMSPLILSRQNGAGIKYLADMREELDTDVFPTVKVSMDTLPYQLNKRELRLATLSEQMRLFYVAMTRAEKKLYLVGKGSSEKLVDKYSGKSENNHLPVAEREAFMTFQDWMLAIHEAYKNLPFKVKFVTDEDLTEEKIGQIEVKSAIKPDDLSNNRQSENIAEALERLEAVEELNAKYQSAINLPSLRTPSQVKKLYEPVMDTDGVDVMAKTDHVKPSFALPDFSKKAKVEATAIGSAMHELMQRIFLSQKVTLEDISTALAQVSAEDEVKARIRLENVLDFFENSTLGQLIQQNTDKIYREAPFAMLKEDPESKEKFVVRGIVDAYLLLEDRLVLLDYKTDKYTNSEEIKDRYQGQMALYAEALSKSYHIDQVDKYLVLLGGERLEVVKL
ncbi:ATP-dependent deoxyribonuclease (subunit A) [Streptococcus infantarius subsp. infantarius]|uniref:helicase-exonuclease AddAB subunit AddA n=1 Tax=uncultured Streptococcus sp. TaxID=83427 RepID=UPI00208E8FC0|nr:helicase-exonuclease AddAB subunit AddA [uncultured Streptococcus sp.]MCO4646998.1 ATP-dependent deoxyribonuclease (subunit A) [Streptococcus infantarius subsp. infantarius]MCO4655409.1 ATP-dependent deoxyribonuclease (subunit A) [Streptococcus infantarius subsp. infantarius]MCO4659463.1 ATP-dependent deoxyribonuclease (subunit A) [Streptococcus infantarius subsp. infantarius]MCO4660644.1 ATP-dependent deoxyribonuclease (subunit A) [Streptococcus infantarius subsp. infantarius]MCO4662838.1 